MINRLHISAEISEMLFYTVLCRWTIYTKNWKS